MKRSDSIVWAKPISDPYLDGVQAFERGVVYTRPRGRTAEDRALWRRGWRDAKAERERVLRLGRRR